MKVEALKWQTTFFFRPFILFFCHFNVIAKVSMAKYVGSKCCHQKPTARADLAAVEVGPMKL